MLTNAFLRARLPTTSIPRAQSLLTPPSRSFSGFAYPCPRRLREIMKMSAIERESTATIEMIWNSYHQMRSHTVSKVLSPTLYMQLMQNGQASPMFVLPVPKDNGYFMLLCQN